MSSFSRVQSFWRRYEDASRLYDALAEAKVKRLQGNGKVAGVTIEVRADNVGGTSPAAQAIADLMRADVEKYADAALVKARDMMLSTAHAVGDELAAHIKKIEAGGLNGR